MAQEDNPTLPMVVTMRVECAECGHKEDETYEFDMPIDNSHPMEEQEPGMCPACGARILIYLRRTKALQ